MSNQEDSLVINQGAIDRGLFNGCKFTFYKTELEQREEFANPDVTNTTDIKAACYDKLVNGIIKKGTIVNKNDAIIGKVMKLTGKNAEDNYQYIDRSIIYKEEEPAVVHNVIIDRNEDDEQFAKVVLRKLREVSIGDKFSSRAGQKGVCGILLKDEDMPSNEYGVRPSIIVNPHALPSRMTIGQLIESLSGTLCAEKCAQVDATMFKKVDVESIATELENLGLDRYGYQRLYSGITGEYIDCEIFMGPTYYQRLQKFTIDTQYATSKGASDVLTYQPTDGKSSGGGLRLGEMELWALESHGGAKFMTEKLLAHSDGFTEYICKNCGKTAIVNQKENIYKCNYCKDNADIYAVPTSWSAKLFVQELESMNVGIRRKGDPYTYEIQEPRIYEILDEHRKA